jgi:tRNA-dihydrouridine synthase A
MSEPYENSWRFSVAPMMDWTDRHCRVFHRMLSKHALLYTEMVTTGALLFGDQHRHLDYSEVEHPIALQLGGSEPTDLAKCAQLAQSWGYDEVNLNCGCPSERVQRGAFGACLMAEPTLVAQCVSAMRDACDLPVTVKHRIGLGKDESYSFVRDFVGEVAQAGATSFIVHARNAWLQGLSPKENREVPPLRYGVLSQLKTDFPDLLFILNGGLRTHDEVAGLPANGVKTDGVMFGRAAYDTPCLLAQVDSLYFGTPMGWSLDMQSIEWRLQIAEQLLRYAHAQQLEGVPPRALTRHVMGLFHGLPGGRLWRRELSSGAFAGSDAVAAITAAMKHLRP